MPRVLTVFVESVNTSTMGPDGRWGDPESALDTATAAMRHWQSGAAVGDWSRLLAMLDPDLTFQVPVAGFAGVQRGAAAAARFFDYLSAVLRADLEVTSTLGDGSRIAFEVSVRGTMLDRAFIQALCLVFAVDDGRISAFREYLAWPGGLDPG